MRRDGGRRVTDQGDVARESLFEAWGLFAVAAVLVWAFFTGGGAFDRGLGDVIGQLLALPVIGWALFAQLGSFSGRPRIVALSVLSVVVLAVLVQQTPLPESLWRAIDVRDALANDLAIAGASDARYFWSLTPLASERGLWSMLPAIAVFLGALSMPRKHHLKLLLLVALLSATSLLLAFFQLGVPQDSILNPFPEWPARLNGFFANANHQSSGFAVSVIIIAAILFDRWRGTNESPAMSRWQSWTLAAIGLLMLASMPLAGSVAASLLAMLALMAIPALSLIERPWRHERPWVNHGAKFGLLVLATGLFVAAMNWMRSGVVHGDRGPVAIATAAMGNDHAPAGAGLGSFVSWFDQAGPEAFRQWEYYNHAHNEFAQWWLESGVVGAVALAAVLFLLVRHFPARRRVSDAGVAVAAWLGCVVLLLHSAVDYPLRTPALMSVGGLLLGIVVAQRSRRERKSGSVDAAMPGHDVDTPSYRTFNSALAQSGAPE